MPSELELTVGDEQAGQRLDQLLAEPLGSRSRAVRLIEQELVTVDGGAVAKSHVVTPGEKVVVQAVSAAPVAGTQSGGPPGAATSAAPGTPRPPAAEQADYRVAFEDEHLIVVDKPAGVVVHPARGHSVGTLAQALSGRAAGGADPYRAGIVHRLDKDTSGLLVVAKSDAAHRALKELLAKRELHREYTALVDGLPPARTGTIDAPIGRDRRDRVLVSLETDVPREARTHFEVVEVLHDAALLKVVLDTGRTHQIRVHMRAIGHPVTGDVTYGGSVRYGLTRQFLNAARLSFPHPFDGSLVDVESPLPEDLAAALALARDEAQG